MLVPGPLAFEVDRLADITLLTDVQIGELVGCKGATIKSWRIRGIGPVYVYINGKPRASVGAVRKWLARIADHGADADLLSQSKRQLGDRAATHALINTLVELGERSKPPAAARLRLHRY